MPDGKPVINADALSKRFRFPSIPKQATLKDLVVRRMRSDKQGSFVDALDDVSFSATRGQTLGIVGRNGSGKTTLLRIMAGVLRPDRGRVEMHGHVAPLLSLGTGFHPLLSGRENARIELLTLGLTRLQAIALIDRVVEFSELEEFIDAPLRTYSAGMAMRLAFAVAVCVDPDILLLDEILAVGDEAFAYKCLACIASFKERGATTVLVTHNAHVVETQCDVALWLDAGRVAGYGEPGAVVEAYRRSLGDADASAL